MILFPDLTLTLTLSREESNGIRKELSKAFDLLGEEGWKGSLELLCWKLIDGGLERESSSLVFNESDARELMDDIWKMEEGQKGPFLKELWASLWTTFNDQDCH